MMERSPSLAHRAKPINLLRCLDANAVMRTSVMRRGKRASLQGGRLALKTPFLVGASGLGAGLEYRHVRLVVHIDEPYGLMEFMQKSCCAGRDRRAAASVVVLRNEYQPPTANEATEMNEHALHQYFPYSIC